MGSNAYGESSKKSNTNETDIDPPKLKKARFLWEVKGNYHLKDDESNKISHKSTSQAKICSLQNDSNEESKQNPNTLTTRNICNENLESVPGRCCVQSFLDKSEILLHNNTVESSDYSCHHNDLNDSNFLNWHNKQMVRYDIENKINAAIEACLGENPTEYVNLDISNIVEEIENDIEVKDQGILMAIESCGLKTNDCIHREIQQDVYNENNISKPSKSSNHYSELNSNITEGQVSHSPQYIFSDNTLQSDEPRNYEINSKFWNTAVSAAIYEKGLTYYE